MAAAHYIYILPLAHGNKPHNFHDLIRTWGFEPLVLVSLALAAWLYIRGLRRLWRGAGVGHGVHKWEAWCYAAGWFALVSRLHPWGSVLFSAHMTQHEILMLIAAPLLVLGRPLVVFLHAIPPIWSHYLAELSNRRWWAATWRVISSALFAWLLHAVVLWVWHFPPFFQATLESDLIHTLQHLSFLLSALLFWWAVMHTGRAVAYGMAVLYMFTTAIHSGLLGVLITLTKNIWYPAYANTTQSWGLTPLEDQQLGGLIMWIPAGIVYIVAALAFMAGWMRESERRVLQRESPALQPTAGA